VSIDKEVVEDRRWNASCWLMGTCQHCKALIERQACAKTFTLSQISCIFHDVVIMTENYSLVVVVILSCTVRNSGSGTKAESTNIQVGQHK
jgi:hypothetical protein